MAISRGFFVHSEEIKQNAQATDNVDFLKCFFCLDRVQGEPDKQHVVIGDDFVIQWMACILWIPRLQMNFYFIEQSHT